MNCWTGKFYRLDAFQSFDIVQEWHQVCKMCCNHPQRFPFGTSSNSTKERPFKGRNVLQHEDINYHNQTLVLLHTQWHGCWCSCSECQVQVYQAASAPSLNSNVRRWLHAALCCHYYRHLTTNHCTPCKLRCQRLKGTACITANYLNY